MADFILDSSVLSGTDFNFIETIIEDRGRSIQLEWTQGGVNQDFELYGYSIRAFPGEPEAKETP